MGQCYLMAMLLLIGPYLAEGKRPFWIIAHMVNNIEHIDASFDDGANAIEADVTFDSSGKPLYLYHGFPCDFFRWCWDWEYVPPYIEAVRQRTTPGHEKYNSKFTLMEFDFKLGSVLSNNLEKAGKLFAEEVNKIFDSPSKVKVILSIPKLSQKNFFVGFRKEILKERSELIKNFGYEFSDEKETDLEIIHAAFESVGVKPPYIWLSNGLFNGGIFDIEFDDLLQHRDQPGKRFASKVYGWTADKSSTLRRWIGHGLDAIITNKPKTLEKVLEGFWKTHRLATQDDNPFEWIETPFSPKPSYTWYGCSYQWARFGSYCWKTCAEGDCWIDAYCGGNADVCYQDRPCRNKDEESKC